jgi:hypothetical protein
VDVVLIIGDTLSGLLVVCGDEDVINGELVDEMAVVVVVDDVVACVTGSLVLEAFKLFLC